MALKDKLMTLEDFKAVRDVDVASNSAQFTEIKADLGAQTGIISKTPGYYINLTTDPVDISNPSPSSTGLTCAVVDCSEGDKFAINAVGAVNGRAWGFLDSSNHVLSMADANATVTDLELTAPTNAAKLIINDKGGGMSYKVGNNLASKLGNSAGLSDAVKAALLTCFRNVAWISENEGQYYQQLENALYTGGSVTPTKRYYTKWSTTPQDDTWGTLIITAGISIQEAAYGTGKNGKPPSASINDARAAIHTSSNFSDYKIKYVSDGNSTFPTNVDLYAIELPPKTTGFNASFSASTGSCLYVFKYNETDDEYYVVSSYTSWYTSSQVVSGLDSNSKYIICGSSKVTSQQAITITTTQLS